MVMFGSLARRSPWRHLRLWAVVAWILICWIGNPADLTAQEAPLKEIRFSAMEGVYPNVSRKDGKLALELLMQKTILKKSYPYTVDLSFIDPETDVPGAIRQGGHHFVTLSSIDYYRYRDIITLEPIMTPCKVDSATVALVLLTPRFKNLGTMARKEERTLIIETGTSGDLSKLWLDTLLLARGHGVTDKFFTHIRRVSKPNRAVLPVFFNQADACIVPGHSVEAIKELNPQIDKKIHTLYRSDDLVRLMICATDQPTREDVEILVRETTRMENNPQASQAMTILQIKRFVKLQRDDLEATEKLLNRHSQMIARHTK